MYSCEATNPVFFFQEVQVLKSLVLGEEERGQSQYQVMCFIFHFPKDSFISSDAMSKLRQKNPSAIRSPEDDLGKVNHTMSHVVILKHAGIISPHIVDLCAEAGLATYTLHEDIVKWSTVQGIPVTSYKPALRKFPTSEDHFPIDNVNVIADSQLPKCTDMKNMWAPCECHLELCIGWYPCGLKYCKGKGQSRNSLMSYRCGIRTCKICHLFAYYVSQKQQCLWDE
ncbi:hypothetical protein JTB14_011356 [Gonioctena quinquepunctata]|nr:hypothetical protein JTB14_011356 [Gonioctena quinquepunctata]